MGERMPIMWEKREVTEYLQDAEFGFTITVGDWDLPVTLEDGRVGVRDH